MHQPMTIFSCTTTNFCATVAVIVAGGGGCIVNVSRETVLSTSSCGLGTLKRRSGSNLKTLYITSLNAKKYFGIDVRTIF